ncbi:class I SAM-dependent methyltransferase, partial [Bacteroidota bacterium]
MNKLNNLFLFGLTNLFIWFISSSVFCQTNTSNNFYDKDERWAENLRRDTLDNLVHLKVMDLLGVTPEMKIGEAGAGDGYFTFHLSKRIGKGGIIYANDIHENSLKALKYYAKEFNVLNNITTIIGKVDDPCFPQKNLDLIVIYGSFHDFEKRYEWLINARKYLKPGGKLAIFDGYYPDHGGLTKKIVNNLGKKAGFRLLLYKNCSVTV